MEKTFVQNIHDFSRINEVETAPAGKRWYFVSSSANYYTNTHYTTYNLAPVVTLCGKTTGSDNERKVFVKVKNLLNKWGHEENPDTVNNAIEYLWESGKLSRKNMLDIWKLVRSA